jgi:hypothetical protein
MATRAKAAQSGEAKILLLCAQTKLCETSRNELVELLRTDIDFNKLLQLAEYHGIYTFLHQHLLQHGGNLIPRRIVETLRNSARLKARHNFLLAAELLRIKDRLEQESIGYFSIKGPCLAMQAYGSLSQRVFLDLDLIVSPDEVPAAIKVIGACGYSQEPRRDPPMSHELMSSKLFRKFSHEQAFALRQGRREDPSFVLDLHWGIAEHSVMQILPETLKQFVTDIEVCGQSVPTLQAELALVTLCAHGTKHQWEYLKWLVDISELLRSHPSIDWETVYQLCEKHGITKKMDLALWLCAKSLGAGERIPPEILSRVAGSETLLKLAGMTVDSWFDPNCRRKDLRHYLQYQSATFNSPVQTTRFLLRELCYPTLPTYLRCPLPPQLFFLYFLIHPALLAGDFLVDNLIKPVETKQSGAIGHAH